MQLRINVVMDVFVQEEHRVYLHPNFDLLPEGLEIARRCASEVYPIEELIVNTDEQIPAGLYLLIARGAAADKAHKAPYVLATRLNEVLGVMPEKRRKALVKVHFDQWPEARKPRPISADPQPRVPNDRFINRPMVARR